jgi:hypothetical protein
VLFCCALALCGCLCRALCGVCVCALSVCGFVLRCALFRHALRWFYVMRLLGFLVASVVLCVCVCELCAVSRVLCVCVLCVVCCVLRAALLNAGIASAESSLCDTIY